MPALTLKDAKPSATLAHPAPGEGPFPWRLAAVGLTVLAPFSGLLLHRWLPSIPDPRIRTRLLFAGAVPVFAWLGVFAYVVLPRFELALGQVTLATLWAIAPLAVFGGLILWLDEAARGTPAASTKGAGCE